MRLKLNSEHLRTMILVGITVHKSMANRGPSSKGPIRFRAAVIMLTSAVSGYIGRLHSHVVNLVVAARYDEY